MYHCTKVRRTHITTYVFTRFEWFTPVFAPGHERYHGEVDTFPPKVPGGDIWQEIGFQNEIRVDCKGHQAAIDRVVSKLERDGPYDVLFGFSKGALMVNMVTHYLLKTYPARALPWKLSVLNSSYLFSRDSNFFENYMSGRWGKPNSKGDSKVIVVDVVDQPVICVSGKKDHHNNFMMYVQHMYRDARQIIHSHGHTISRDPHIVKKVCDEMFTRCRPQPAITKVISPILVASPKIVTSPKPIKILCLHGNGMNSMILQLWTGQMQEILGSHAQFDFLQGDNSIQKDSK